MDYHEMFSHKTRAVDQQIISGLRENISLGTSTCTHCANKRRPITSTCVVIQYHASGYHTGTDTVQVTTGHSRRPFVREERFGHALPPVVMDSGGVWFQGFYRLAVG